MLTMNVGGMKLEEKEKGKTSITSVAEKEIVLLSRHLEILKTVKNQGPIGIIRLSQLTGQPQHMVRYSLRTLENDGVIRPSPSGAIVTDKIHETLGTIDSTIDDIITHMHELKKKLK